MRKTIIKCWKTGRVICEFSGYDRHNKAYHWMKAHCQGDAKHCVYFLRKSGMYTSSPYIAQDIKV